MSIQNGQSYYRGGRAGQVLGAGLGGRALGGADAAGEHEQLTIQAQRLVAQTFYGVLLKQMRDSPFRSDLLDGGRGGQAYASLYDQHLVDRVAARGDKRLARSIVRRIEARKAYARSASGGEAPARPADQTPGSRKPSAPAQPNPFEHVRIHVAPAFGT